MEDSRTEADATVAAATVVAATGDPIEEFGARLRGKLLRPFDPGYDEARRIWNGMIDRRPALIVRCAGVADVIASVDFARTTGLTVAVRGGGHNVAGNAVCDGGIMIDLSGMRSVRVDPAARTARVEPGATWGDFDHETLAFGLATTGGVVSSTGVAGLTLGGGIGWLHGRHGLSCDNLLSVDIVTADGRLLHASSDENPDLFWGVRGGGGNFGIVTSFEFRLHPVDMVVGGLVIYPAQLARDILRSYRAFVANAPDEFTSTAILTTSPEGHPVLIIGACYNGPIEEGIEFIRPLREFAPPIVDMLGPIPYRVLQTMTDAGFPAGMLNYWKSNFVNDLDDELIDILLERFSVVASPKTALLIEACGGMMRRVDPEATAFHHRNSPYNILIVGIWTDPTRNETNIDWVRATWNAIQPFSSGGVYVNYLGRESDEGSNRIDTAYGAEKFARLTALKNRYDPTNLFSMNQNIRPTV